MITKQEIDQKYINQHSQLEAEFFDIVEEGLPTQHRVLKDGKIIGEFNQRHGNLWKAHEAELIAEGLMEAPIPPELVRDLTKERMDELEARIASLEAKE